MHCILEKILGNCVLLQSTSNIYMIVFPWKEHNHSIIKIANLQSAGLYLGFLNIYTIHRMNLYNGLHMAGGGGGGGGLIDANVIFQGVLGESSSSVNLCVALVTLAHWEHCCQCVSEVRWPEQPSARSVPAWPTQCQKCADLTNPASEVCRPDQPSVRSVLTWPIQHQVCQPDQSSIRSVQTRPTQSEMCTCQQSPDASLFHRSAIETFSVDLIDDVCTTSVHNPPWSIAFQASHTLYRHTHTGSCLFLCEFSPLTWYTQCFTDIHTLVPSFSLLKICTSSWGIASNPYNTWNSVTLSHTFSP